MKRSCSSSDTEKEDETRSKCKREKKHNKKKSQKRTKERSHKKQVFKEHEKLTVQPSDNKSNNGATDYLPSAPSISQEEFKQLNDAYTSGINAGNTQILIEAMNKLPAMIENSKKIMNTILPKADVNDKRQIQNSFTIKSSNDGSIEIRIDTNEKTCKQTRYPLKQHQSADFKTNNVYKPQSMNFSEGNKGSLAKESSNNPPVPAMNLGGKRVESTYQHHATNFSSLFHPMKISSIDEVSPTPSHSYLNDIYLRNLATSNTVNKTPRSATITGLNTMPAFAETNSNINEKTSLIKDPKQENIFQDTFDEIPQNKSFPKEEFNPVEKEQIKNKSIENFVYAAQTSPGVKNCDASAVSGSFFDNFKSSITLKEDAKPLYNTLSVHSDKNATKNPKSLNIFEDPNYVYKETSIEKKVNPFAHLEMNTEQDFKKITSPGPQLKIISENLVNFFETCKQNSKIETCVLQPYPKEKNIFDDTEETFPVLSSIPNPLEVKYSCNSLAANQTDPRINKVLQQDFTIPPPPLGVPFETISNPHIHNNQPKNFNILKTQIVRDNIFGSPVSMAAKEKSSPTIDIERKLLSNYIPAEKSDASNFFYQQNSSPGGSSMQICLYDQYHKIKVARSGDIKPDKNIFSDNTNNDDQQFTAGSNNHFISNHSRPRDIISKSFNNNTQNNSPTLSHHLCTSTSKLNTSNNLRIGSSKELHDFLPEKCENVARNVPSNTRNDVVHTSNTNHGNQKTKEMTENPHQLKGILKKTVHFDASIQCQEIKNPFQLQRKQVSTKHIEAPQGPINYEISHSPRSKNDGPASDKLDEDSMQATEFQKNENQKSKQGGTRKKIFESWKDSQIISPASLKTLSPKSVLQNATFSTRTGGVKDITCHKSTLQTKKQKEQALMVEPSTCSDKHVTCAAVPQTPDKKYFSENSTISQN